MLFLETIPYRTNLEKNVEKKEYDEKCERLLNQMEKENLLLKDEIRRKIKSLTFY